MAFTQEQLLDGYNQMTIERAADAGFASTAADLLSQLIHWPRKVQSRDEQWPGPAGRSLRFPKRVHCGPKSTLSRPCSDLTSNSTQESN